MIIATWILSDSAVRIGDVEKKHIVACASLLIVPWMFISMIAGLGPPPFGKPVVWLASITEQEIRYIILVIAAVLYALGFAILREKLKSTKGNLYSLLGFTFIQIAIPLFLIDMIFLSYYVEEMYRIMVKSSLEKMPEWALPMANQSRYIPIIEDSLIYIATAAFAASLKTAGWFKPAACNIYIIISLLGVLLNMLPRSVPEPLAIISFIATIPAALFLMPYLMGINLLRRAGN
ncbi:MAG: hypothetical protein ACHQF0_06085 [Chitinophagales bacterium]